MRNPASGKTPCVALVGNPNTGKSTLFSALAGVRQRVGNYPGVTVEKKIGRATLGGRPFELVDLPGTYSLAPRSLDEMVAVDVLLGRLPDAPPIDCVLSIVDAGNLERNLYLVSQVLALGLPTVIALNMVDVAKSRGIAIDAAKLSQRLRVPVVAVQANARLGLKQLGEALARVADAPAPHADDPFPEAFRQEVQGLQAVLNHHEAPAPNQSTPSPPLPSYLVERLLLDSSGYLEGHLLNGARAPLHDALVAARQRLAASGYPVPAVEAMARYEWIGRMLFGVIERPAARRETGTDKIDRVLTHKVWGTLFFLAMMLVVFTSVFVVASPAMEWISGVVAGAGELIGNPLGPGALKSLLVDGVIGGVGGVLVFLPQILILFFFIAILEDCGYMARAAFLMDRMMSRVGLSGKSFIPLLSSFACAVPGIMATRVIENRRDRLATILVAPLMSCSARLPVYTILIAAFVPRRAYAYGLLRLDALVMLSMYLLGVVVAAVMALVLKKTLLRGPAPPFVLELPTYKWPSARAVVGRMVERGGTFVYRAGTLILAVTILVWAAGYFPHDQAKIEGPFEPQRLELAAQLNATPESDVEPRRRLAEQLAKIDNEIAAAYQRQSILGRLGHAIEPAVRPLGWDWRIGSAVLASFPAREVVVGVLGVIYDLGAKLDVGAEDDQNRMIAQLRAAKWDETDTPVYNLPVALSIMVFFALCAQCASTLVIIRRETNSWRWPAFTFAYMTGLAYLGALVTYQVGRLLL